MACFPVRSNESAPNRVEQGIGGLGRRRQSTHRRQRLSHMAEESAFPTSSPWLKCCQQGNALIETSPKRRKATSPDKRAYRHQLQNRRPTRSYLRGHPAAWVEDRKLTDGPTSKVGHTLRYIPLTISMAFCIRASCPARRWSGDSSTGMLGVTPLPSIKLPCHVRYAATGNPTM